MLMHMHTIVTNLLARILWLVLQPLMRQYQEQVAVHLGQQKDKLELKQAEKVCRPHSYCQRETSQLIASIVKAILFYVTGPTP